MEINQILFVKVPLNIVLLFLLVVFYNNEQLPS